jgi:N-acetyl-gamma-glutamyl-phosphate reductase
VHKLPVGILGASGYAGRELVSLVAGHPGLSLAFATANERRGAVVRAGSSSVTLVATDDAPLGDAALVFSALPHGASSAWVERARAAGARAVDLSADLRPGNGAHHAAGALAAAVGSSSSASLGIASHDAAAIAAAIPYGLTELTRDQVRGASIVANPGCYPTAIVLGITPLLTRGLIPRGATVHAAAASGVTGAGFTARTDLLFGEVTEDYRAYGIGNEHRHLPEMRAMIGELGGDVDLLFTPHLLPVARGILATITVPVTEPVADPLALWREHFAGEPFVEISNEPPSLKDVVRRNVVRIHVRHVAHVRTPTLIILAAIDNLVKGAAGQAVQNANLMLGLEETAGLPQ